jgi:very-short-patch-repair endonuclease
MRGALPHAGASSAMVTERHDFARHLRRHATRAEDTLWQALRNRRLGGAKFRRQVPLGAFVVDLLCAEARLIIEIDGVQHDWFDVYDARRTRHLEAMGYRVIRFSNAQVLDDLEGTLQSIRRALADRVTS